MDFNWMNLLKDEELFRGLTVCLVHRLNGELIAPQTLDNAVVDRLTALKVIERVYVGTCPVCGTKNISVQNPVGCAECGGVFELQNEMLRMTKASFSSLKKYLSSLSTEDVRVVPLTLSHSRPGSAVRLDVSPMLVLSAEGTCRPIVHDEKHMSVFSLPWECVGVLVSETSRVVSEVMDARRDAIRARVENLFSEDAIPVEVILAALQSKRKSARLVKGEIMLGRSRYHVINYLYDDWREYLVQMFRAKRQGFKGAVCFVRTPEDMHHLVSEVNSSSFDLIIFTEDNIVSLALKSHDILSLI